MCEATTIIAVAAVAGVALAAAGTGVQLYSQSEDASAQANYQKKLAEARNRQIEENYQLARASADEQNKALQARMVQEGAAASLEEQRAQRERAQAEGTARAASAEAGVAGLSVDALMGDFLAQEARYRDSIRGNLAFSTDQMRSEMEGASLTAKGRNQSISPFLASPVAQPNYLAAGLRVGGDAVSSYEKYRYKGSSTSSSSGRSSVASSQIVDR